ncbi:hypothetical protein KCP76_03770 [Salmonella enterica subsp. enterica serovar Weltevreden]|nr:hypothetical protein KCP76_03770 [Salmonella enterica subsp. enterica serovar Weltevreden]
MTVGERSAGRAEIRSFMPDMQFMRRYPPTQSSSKRTIHHVTVPFLFINIRYDCFPVEIII